MNELGDKKMNEEYLMIIEKIITNRKFQKLKNERHHTTTRYDHSVDVSYKTYKICKKLNLDYKSATRAALLHDFFFDEEFKSVSNQKKLFTHYKQAIKNANKLIQLNTKEENIIASHMFPVGGKKPKYLESVIVDVVDDAVSIQEQVNQNAQRLKNAFYGFLVVITSFLLK